MKKSLYTLVMVFALGLVANAQNDWFVANWENIDNFDRTEIDMPMFPVTHGLTENTNLPLGSGLFILGALGAGYATLRRRKE